MLSLRGNVTFALIPIFALAFSVASSGQPQRQVAAQLDLPSESNGIKTTIYLSRLSEAQVFDIRSSQVTTIDLTSQGRSLVVFVSASDPVSCMEQFSAFKNLSKKYSDDALREVFIIIRSTKSGARALANALPFAPTAKIYWDNAGDVDRLVQLPRETPFGVLILGNPAHVAYAWERSKVEDPSDPLDQAMANSH